MTRKTLYICALAAVLAVSGCTREPEPSGVSVASPPALDLDSVSIAKALDPVGTQTCAKCHAEQFQSWSGSHHDLAMQKADAASVLADFSAPPLESFGRTTRFFVRDGRYFVNTDGPDQEAADFEVKYTFGVYPLQQYLVELPGGRIQALTAAWDSRSTDEGGGRWFSLDQQLFDRDSSEDGGTERTQHAGVDVLHWTGAAYRWNSACADCHSTNVVKGFQPDTVSYRTTFSETDVACEACHGFGSEHVRWAAQTASGGAAAPLTNAGFATSLGGDDEPVASSWIPGQPGVAPHRRQPLADRLELETCAPCHSRREVIAPGHPGSPFLDSYRPSLLVDGLYFVDGQMLDEVFVYGSFLQSKMHDAGVRCSDCHDPHSLQLKAPGAQVCLQCHTAQSYDTPVHHHHEKGGSEGESLPTCLDCHMPTRTYMGVDARRDHSFRVPRPDIGAVFDVPNACSDCHTDQSPEWALESIESWGAKFPPFRRAFARAFEGGRRGEPGAAGELRTLASEYKQPAIVRATALSLLANYPDAATADVLLKASREDDPLLRWGAVLGAELFPIPHRVDLLTPLLKDPLRVVRLAAARSLAGTAEELAPSDRDALNRAIEEYRGAALLNADSPASHVNLGMLELALNDRTAARRRFEKAIDVADYFIPAYLALAELSRLEQDDAAGEVTLSGGLRALPGNAELLHARGLSRVRTGQAADALADLAAAAEAAPTNVRFAYVYGIALHSGGQLTKAIEVFQAALLQAPRSVELLSVLAGIHRDLGRKQRAEAYLARLAEIVPNDPSVRRLRRELELLPPG
jgi:predicted CXXCH cytochrome family protein